MIKVLFIEDDPQQIFLYQEVFNLKGLLTIIATTGDEAFKMLFSEKPDIILADIILQNENGLDIVGKIKHDSRYSAIPVVVFTNSDKQEYKDRALSLGTIDFIVKADTIPQEVAEKIKNIFKAYQSSKKN
ncbi:MAG: response regulator [Candidatus Komeilibacteria bacterium]|nr:response regulator [Candidatus Komeilibacteria bacterium]